jgi:hypothetical protein
MSLSLTKIHNPEPGWYSGDFHAHTLYSDGVLTPTELAAFAHESGLDFFAMTDHNTAGSYDHFGDTGDLVVIPGVEVTLDNLHYNAFGLKGDLDWAQAILNGPIKIKHPDLPEGVNRWLGKAARQHCLNSLNHPLLEPWHCQMLDFDISQLDCLEIWNDPSWPTSVTANVEAVRMWTDWLNAGHRKTAIGGSDFHRPQPKPGQDKPAERIGVPRTWVDAQNLSGAAILEALRQRKAYVSMGPKMDFRMQFGDHYYTIGQDAGPLEGAIRFFCAVSDLDEPFLVKLIQDGEERYMLGGSGPSLKFEFPFVADPSVSTWYRLDVTRMDGEILAISNPIFLGPAPEPGSSDFGDYVNGGPG